MPPKPLNFKLPKGRGPAEAKNNALEMVRINSKPDYYPRLSASGKAKYEVKERASKSSVPHPSDLSITHKHTAVPPPFEFVGQQVLPSQQKSSFDFASKLKVLSKHKIPLSNSPDFRRYMDAKITIDLPTFRLPFSAFVQNVPYLNFCSIIQNWRPNDPTPERFQVNAAYIQILLKKFDVEKKSTKAVKKMVENSKAKVNKESGEFFGKCKRKLEDVDDGMIKRLRGNGGSTDRGASTGKRRAEEAAEGMLKISKESKVSKDHEEFGIDFKIGELNVAIQQANSAEAEKYWTQMAQIYRVKELTDADYWDTSEGEETPEEALASFRKLSVARRAAGLQSRFYQAAGARKGHGRQEWV